MGRRGSWSVAEGSECSRGVGVVERLECRREGWSVGEGDGG